MDAQPISAAKLPPSMNIRTNPSRDFDANFNGPTDYNAGRARREGIAIANLDSQVSADDIEQGPVRYHDNIKQGSDEWLAMRKNYDITGSTVGTLLGNGSYTTMKKKIAELEDLYPTSRDTDSAFAQQMFARGHASEAAARPRVEQQFGINIKETGAITNSDYPNMMYSPDGLIGDDALWEHKNPNVTKKFANLGEGEHQDYMDQIQMGMHLSGRSRTLFSQTVGNNTQSEWIDADPNWYTKNKDQLDSIAGRREAVRDYVSSNRESYESAMAATSDEKQQNLLTRRFRLGAQKAATGDANEFINPNYDPYDSSGSRYGDIGAGGGGNRGGGGGNVPPGAPPSGPDEPNDKMALSVKTGIILANEELKAKQSASGQASADADFAPGGSHTVDSMLEDAGYSKTTPPDNKPFNMFGKGPMGDILGGIAGGTLSSTRGGVMSALKNGGPIGQTIALGVGAANVGGEAISAEADYVGRANDFGETSSVRFDSLNQGMEMLGLNQDQAERVNQVTHSDYNRLENGDASGVIRVATGTRGLLSVSDIREAAGDPVRLATIFRQRAEARGWSQARIAGAAEMAGLTGFGRVAQASEGQFYAASNNVRRRSSEDVEQGQTDFRNANASRAASSTDYSVPRYALESGGSAARAAGDTMYAAASGVDKAFGFMQNHDEALRRLESNNNPNAVSPTGAKGRYQVLDSTNRDPGYGVQPAQNDSVAERERVGRDYYGALLTNYKGDPRKADAAYTDGPGTVDAAAKKYGDDWLKHMPQQAQKRVADMEKMGVYDGAGRFAGGTAGGSKQATTVNVTIEATVNNKQASATVSTPNGQTATQTINMGNGAMQRR